MIESQNRVREIIPEEIMLARLEQSEQMRAFFIEMWKQNPSLAKQGGARVKDLLTPLEHGDDLEGCSEFSSVPAISKQRGVSLIELIIFILIVSTALIGILSVMNIVNKNSADPVIHKQALAIAESLLEEIELQDFAASSGNVSAGTVTAANRTGYHIVREYDTFTMPTPPGIISVNGVAVPGLGNYSASVAVQNAVLGTITAASASAVQITVTVTDPAGNTLQSVGYRAAY
jgi:MSHA pilin protein MshD